MLIWLIHLTWCQWNNSYNYCLIYVFIYFGFISLTLKLDIFR